MVTSAVIRYVPAERVKVPEELDTQGWSASALSIGQVVAVVVNVPVVEDSEKRAASTPPPLSSRVVTRLSSSLTVLADRVCICICWLRSGLFFVVPIVSFCLCCSGRHYLRREIHNGVAESLIEEPLPEGAAFALGFLREFGEHFKPVLFLNPELFVSHLDKELGIGFVVRVRSHWHRRSS